MEDFKEVKPRLTQIQRYALIAGVLGAILCVFGFLSDSEQFYRSYLLGYVFWVGLALGGLALMALHHLVGGGWGFAIQRILETCTRTLPLMIVLFIPIVVGMQEIYIWARPEVVAADEILQHKAPYLNFTGFIVRAAAYFVIWGIFIFLINRWSGEQDRSGAQKLTDRIRAISGPTILLYVLTVSFASIDWVMSLEPHWFSTIFGFIFVIGQAVLTLAFAIVWVALLARHKPLSEVVTTKQFHDLGNLLLAFVSLWAYISFSQFIIIWSGNLPEEIPWYLHRMQGGWEWIGMVLMAFHFAVPFALLLLRRNKRKVEVLSRIAMAMLVMRFVDIYWIVVPNFAHGHISFHWLDIVAPMAIGGFWLGMFVWQLQGRALLPINDPRLRKALFNE